MWLTQIVADPRHIPLDPSTGLIQADDLHKALMALVPGGLGPQARAQSGLLFRVEATARSLNLLTQTRHPPRTDALPAGLVHQIRHRNISALTATLRAGQRVRYRIAANPTKRHGSTAKAGQRGKLQVLHGEAADLWWLRKATVAGLHPTQILARPQPDLLGAGNTRHGVTQFDGVGIVTDPDLLRTALAEGIGRAKTYGCGLLSIGPTGATG